MSTEEPRQRSDAWSQFDDSAKSDLESRVAYEEQGESGDGMPVYMMLSRLTERGRDRVKDHPERILEVNHEVEQRGCVLVSQYALMGPYDFVTIIRAPSNEAMHRLAIDLGARGTIETQTFPAIPTEEFINAMQAQPDF